MHIIFPTNVEFDETNPIHMALHEALKANENLRDHIVKMSIGYRAEIAGLKMRCTCTEYKNGF